MTRRVEPGTVERTKPIVLHVFTKMDCGGAEHRTLELIEHTQEEVTPVIVTIGRGPGSLDDRFRRAGADIINVPLGFGFVPRFLRVLRLVRPHVVHSHLLLFSGVVLTTAKLIGVPVRIAHMRSSAPAIKSFPAANGPLAQGRAWVLRVLIKFSATNVIGVSEDALSGIWGQDWRKDSRCGVFYSGVSIERLRSHGLTRVPEPDIPVLVQIGRVTLEKNARFSIEVLREVVQLGINATLRFVGRVDDTARTDIEFFATENGVYERLLWMGEIDDPASALVEASVLVHPSLREGMPGVVLEAVAVGRPAIVNAVGGVAEIARTSPLVQIVPVSEGPRAWADAIRDALAHRPQQWNTASFDDTFDVRRCADAFVSLWSGLLAPRR